MTILLALAYAIIAALLLNLGLAAAWSARVKIGAVLLVSLFYGLTYLGIRALEGWPTGEPVPADFRLHWISIDEPDKATGSDGAIYFWVRSLDEAELPVGEPRAHVVPYDDETAGSAREALEQLQGGKRLNGQMTMNVIEPSEGEPEEASPFSDSSAGNDPEGPEERLIFEFREVPPPTLPSKPPL